MHGFSLLSSIQRLTSSSQSGHIGNASRALAWAFFLRLCKFASSSSPSSSTTLSSPPPDPLDHSDSVPESYSRELMVHTSGVSTVSLSFGIYLNHRSGSIGYRYITRVGDCSSSAGPSCGSHLSSSSPLVFSTIAQCIDFSQWCHILIKISYSLEASTFLNHADIILQIFFSDPQFGACTKVVVSKWFTP